ncbi:MAG: DMP19 family protein [Planctomycetes bacterium]|nr:DMP19 family protein [Planctomycetota bacterium]
MPSTAVTITVAGVLGSAWALWCWFRPKPRAMKQYARSLVEDPEYHELIDEEHLRLIRAMDEARDAPAPSPDEFPRLIDDLLSADPFRVRPARKHLEKVTAAAEQLLLTTLDDPRANWTEDDTEASGSSPAQRVVRLLESIPSRSLGDRIGHLADQLTGYDARFPIRARVALGRVADLPFVLGKLAEQTDVAEEGVELAMKMGWAEPEFIEAVRAWAERTTFDATLPFSYWAVKFYATHSGPAAIEALQSPQVLSVENNRTVHVALKLMNQHKVRLEPAIVRPLLDKALASPDVWPWECMFEDSLQALAVSDPETATRIAEEYLDSPVGWFQRDATDFLREAAGLPRTYQVNPPDGMKLTDAERGLVDALVECIDVFGEIGNGGLSQYFFNSTGSEWPRHVVALMAIGFEKGAAALEEASRLIHPKGASTNREERIAQYAGLSERKEKRLDELSKLFYGDVPRLRFMLRHKELFARIRKARQEAGMPTE